ncbi:uncharacterized protein SPAPADRAFT_154160 [Spathaspora passalidarum NRRL Y-27907]|uniref:F-box domain-containing protein n=1 Tax=Spathaspora passalidarum (strain NRRL Y-27907 / 11-Y1) TaxID=619300 RepID=G3AR90_SPAPN|nr:uncharacterized protein SPAPADRAFT_154160 [Spathaspora passalidarum NRRL Y-27907]EGW31265.1 hypothetical protein SPAPADRAFT_154160 [Spathaspora passalidarum NRRL Y-27907]
MLLRTNLRRLPDCVITQIFDSVPFDHLMEFCKHYPDKYVRDLLIQYYYCSRVQFAFNPPVPPPKATPGRRNLVTFVDSAVSQFMEDFPEVIPKTLLIDVCMDFKEAREILDKFHDRLVKCEVIDFALLEAEISADDFQFLLSFPNIKRVYFHFNSKLLLPALIDNPKLIKHPTLEHIIFCEHEITDWSGVRFPQNLKTLNLSYHRINFSTLILPQSVHSLSFIYCQIYSIKALRRQMTNELTELKITDNMLEHIVIDDLPRKLHTMDLRRNSIFSITGKEWPKGLKSLILSHNALDDDSLKVINNGVGWPEQLITLDLSVNFFDHTENLSNLPQSLKRLEISSNTFLWRDQENRVEFPVNLTYLGMSDCRVHNLSLLKFPVSLKELQLAHNGIKDLLPYGDWTELINLRQLDLFDNSITTLDNWIPPPNLRELIVENNPITRSPQFNELRNTFKFKITGMKSESNQQV